MEARIGPTHQDAPREISRNSTQILPSVQKANHLVSYTEGTRHPFQEESPNKKHSGKKIQARGPTAEDRDSKTYSPANSSQKTTGTTETYSQDLGGAWEGDPSSQKLF